jgi:hypothetical protein
MEIRIYGSDSPLSGSTKYISDLSGSSAYFDSADITGTTTTNILDATTVSATTIYGNGQNITNLNLNTSISGNYVNKSGDTMTGALTINDNLVVTGTTNISGNTNIGGQILSGGTDIHTLFGGSGEVNTASNVGGGAGIFSGKTGVDLQFRTLSGTSEQKVTAYTQNSNVIVDVIEPNFTLWPLVVQGNQLISGGATYLSGLTFDISALVYIIGETIYNAAASQVTLNSGDTVNDRIDVIYADISGNTGVVEGTPAANPSKPTLDNATQVEVTFVTVPANSAAPDVDITKVYDEAVGSGSGEWDVLSTTGNIFSASTGDAFSGTKSINFSGANSNDQIIFENPTPYDTTNDNTISFYIKNHGAWSSNAKIEISFQDSGGTPTSGTITIDNNDYGFLESNQTDWQVISIGLGDFNMTSNLVSRILFDIIGGPSKDVNCYIDLIRFPAGAPTTSPQNIWLSFIGDDSNVAVANSATDQLRLSGGTNITTSVSNANKRVTFDLTSGINANFIGDGSVSNSEYESLSGVTSDIQSQIDSKVSTTDAQTNYVNTTGDTMSGILIVDNAVTANTLTITGQTNLQGVVKNPDGANRIVFGHSLDPETDRSQTLGRTAKSWGNVFTAKLTLEDDETGGDRIEISAPIQDIGGDIAWQWELPYTGNTSGSLLGITTAGSGQGAQYNSTWYSLSGVNLDITTDTGGTITLSAGTGGGSFNSFTISGDTGSETINDGDNITFAAGSGLTAVVTATDTITYDLDITGTTVEASPASGTKLLVYKDGIHKNIDWDDLPGAGGGETNTASNVGGGNGIFYQKSGVDLQFRSLVAGTNVTITSGATTLTINSSGGGGGSSRVTGSTTTTTTGTTNVDVIDTLTTGCTSVIEVFVTAKDDGDVEYGSWKRTLSVTDFAGTTTIRHENADMDIQSSGFVDCPLTFTVATNDINIVVEGILSTNLQWDSTYEIITKSCN